MVDMHLIGGSLTKRAISYYLRVSQEPSLTYSRVVKPVSQSVCSIKTDKNYKKHVFMHYIHSDNSLNSVC